MPVPLIKIAPSGSSVRVSVKFKSAQAITYSFFLWEAGSNEEVACVRGNNQNPEDDEFSLPMPAGSNVGRLLEGDFSLIDPDPGSDLTKAYRIEVSISQGEVVLDSLVAAGKMTGTRDNAGVVCKFTS